MCLGYHLSGDDRVYHSLFLHIIVIDAPFYLKWSCYKFVFAFILFYKIIIIIIIWWAVHIAFIFQIKLSIISTWLAYVVVAINTLPLLDIILDITSCIKQPLNTIRIVSMDHSDTDIKNCLVFVYLFIFSPLHFFSFTIIIIKICIWPFEKTRKLRCHCCL